MGPSPVSGFWGERGRGTEKRPNLEPGPWGWGSTCAHQLRSYAQWAGVLSRLALEQERILNPLLDRVRTADHHQLRSLTGLIRNLSRNARNKDEMCESGHPEAWALPSPCLAGLTPGFSLLLPIWVALWQASAGRIDGGFGGGQAARSGCGGRLPDLPTILASWQPRRW